MSIHVQYSNAAVMSFKSGVYCQPSIIYPKSTLIDVLVFHHLFLHRDPHDPSHLVVLKVIQNGHN